MSIVLQVFCERVCVAIHIEKLVYDKKRSIKIYFDVNLDSKCDICSARFCRGWGCVSPIFCNLIYDMNLSVISESAYTTSLSRRVIPFCLIVLEGEN